MAGIDVLCSDKTGTLTENRFGLGDPVFFDACGHIVGRTGRVLEHRGGRAQDRSRLSGAGLVGAHGQWFPPGQAASREEAG